MGHRKEAVCGVNCETMKIICKRVSSHSSYDSCGRRSSSATTAQNDVDEVDYVIRGSSKMTNRRVTNEDRTRDGDSGADGSGSN